MKLSRVKYHVTPTGDGDWKTKKSGAERAAGIHKNKRDAIEQAKELAKKQSLGQVIIHDKKGVIQTEHTYRDDPRNIKG